MEVKHFIASCPTARKKEKKKKNDEEEKISMCTEVSVRWDLKV